MNTHIARTILSRRTTWFGAILACCLGQSLHPALAAPGSWTRKANMPMAFDTHASCEVDGILYVVGGHKDPGIYTQLRTLFAYDPQTDSWTRKKDMPTARRAPAACAVDGIIYVIGGGGWWDPTSSAVEAYDPVLNTFTAKRKIPVACHAAAAATINGKIYHSGGANQDPIMRPVGAVYYDSLWAFDPQGGVTPQLLSLNRESPDRVRLAWQGEAGRLYGVESRSNLAAGRCTRVNFSTGTNSILATSELVEATCPVPSADTSRFFRVLEAN